MDPRQHPIDDEVVTATSRRATRDPALEPALIEPALPAGERTQVERDRLRLLVELLGDDSSAVHTTVRRELHVLPGGGLLKAFL